MSDEKSKEELIKALSDLAFAFYPREMGGMTINEEYHVQMEKLTASIEAAGDIMAQAIAELADAIRELKNE